MITLAISERWGLALFTLTGAVLTLGGLLAGARALLRERDNLAGRLQQLLDIETSDLPMEEKARLKQETMPPTSTWLDVLYTREVIRLYVIQQAAENLGTPLRVTLLGVVYSTTASLWSLWT